jgi:hypothetical protein
MPGNVITRSAYDASLLDFPSILYPIAVTLVLGSLYGALALWLLRAACWELSQSSKCAAGEGKCANSLDNHTLVLVLACAASFTSLGYVTLYFLPTLLHGTLGIDELTVAASVFDRLLGAGTDCLFFAASAQLIAFWLELLTSMRSVKRVQRCCWFSAIFSAIFSIARIGAAVVAPASRIAQLSMLGLALLIAWSVTFVGTVAALRLCFHMRNMVARNRAARVIRAKMFRIGRFLAVNGALFLLLNLALLVTGAGATTQSQRSDPIGVLLWELPTRVLRFCFYLSLAWSCSSSAKRPTARSKVEERVRSFADSIRGSRELRGSMASIAEEDDEDEGEDAQVDTRVGMGLRSLARIHDPVYGDGVEESDTGMEGMDLSIALTPKTSMLAFVEMPPKRSTVEMSTLRALREVSHALAGAIDFNVDGQYYYDADDDGTIVTQGPHTVQDLTSLLANGHLHPDNHIREGQDGKLFPLRDLLSDSTTLEALTTRQTADSGLHHAHEPEPTWFYQGVGGELHGPYTLFQLADWVSEGRVLQEDSIRNGREGDPVALGGTLCEFGVFTVWWQRYAIEVGSVVRHPTRGTGRVTVLESTPPGPRVHVEFTEDGATHKYKEASWAKFLPVEHAAAAGVLWGDSSAEEHGNSQTASAATTRSRNRSRNHSRTRTVSTEWERLQLSIAHLEKLAIRTLEGDAEADERDIDGDDAQSSDEGTAGNAPLFELRGSATGSGPSVSSTQELGVARPSVGTSVSSTRRSRAGRSKTMAPWMNSAREGAAGRRTGGRAASDGATLDSAGSPRATFFNAFNRFVGRNSGGDGGKEEPFPRQDGDEVFDERVSMVSIVTPETITVCIDDGGRDSVGSLLDDVVEQGAMADEQNLAAAANPAAGAAPNPAAAPTQPHVARPQQEWWEVELVRVGVRVMHPTRGAGIVINVNDEGDQRVHVDFGGDVHRYSAESWHKSFFPSALVEGVEGVETLNEGKQAAFASRTAQC